MPRPFYAVAWKCRSLYYIYASTCRFVTKKSVFLLCIKFVAGLGILLRDGNMSNTKRLRKCQRLVLHSRKSWTLCRYLETKHYLCSINLAKWE